MPNNAITSTLPSFQPIAWSLPKEDVRNQLGHLPLAELGGLVDQVETFLMASAESKPHMPVPPLVLSILDDMGFSEHQLDLSFLARSLLQAGDSANAQAPKFQAVREELLHRLHFCAAKTHPWPYSPEEGNRALNAHAGTKGFANIQDAPFDEITAKLETDTINSALAELSILTELQLSHTETYAQAEAIYKQKNYQETIQLCHEAIDQGTADARFYALKGQAEYALCQYKEASQSFSAALERGDRRPLLYAALGKAQRRCGQYAEAVHSLCSALYFCGDKDELTYEVTLARIQARQYESKIDFKKLSDTQLSELAPLLDQNGRAAMADRIAGIFGVGGVSAADVLANLRAEQEARQKFDQIAVNAFHVSSTALKLELGQGMQALNPPLTEAAQRKLAGEAFAQSFSRFLQQTTGLDAEPESNAALARKLCAALGIPEGFCFELLCFQKAFQAWRNCSEISEALRLRPDFENRLKKSESEITDISREEFVSVLTVPSYRAALIEKYQPLAQRAAQFIKNTYAGLIVSDDAVFLSSSRSTELRAALQRGDLKVQLRAYFQAVAEGGSVANYANLSSYNELALAEIQAIARQYQAYLAPIPSQTLADFKRALSEKIALHQTASGQANARIRQLHDRPPQDGTTAAERLRILDQSMLEAEDLSAKQSYLMKALDLPPTTSQIYLSIIKMNPGWLTHIPEDVAKTKFTEVLVETVVQCIQNNDPA
ncbi:MAG: hypothetical protein V4623_02525 [Pseudomonadota bacterium]